MSSQMPGLAGACTVETTSFKQAQVVLRQAVRHREIAGLSGASGAGKTYALEAFLASPAMVGVPHTWLQMPPHPAEKEVLVRTINAITGTCNQRDTQYALTEQLMDLLNNSGHVLVVDEAHHLKSKGLQQLRYLHQRGSFSFTLLLAGSDLATTLGSAPELKTRIDGLAVFEPLTGTELLATLRALHPLLGNSPLEQLRYVDRTWATGNFRRWSKFLRTALEIAPATGTDRLNDRLVAATLTALGADAWNHAR